MNNTKFDSAQSRVEQIQENTNNAMVDLVKNIEGIKHFASKLPWTEQYEEVTMSLSKEHGELFYNDIDKVLLKNGILKRKYIMRSLKIIHIVIIYYMVKLVIHFGNKVDNSPQEASLSAVFMFLICVSILISFPLFYAYIPSLKIRFFRYRK